MQNLQVRYFGDPLLREVSKNIKISEIKQKHIQDLISGIKQKVASKKYGVGLAAPQVGYNLALSVIAIKPTPNRPNLKKFDKVIINPKYKGVGAKKAMWEACISGGTNGSLYALVPRYRKVVGTWYDENAKKHTQELSGIQAQVFQHETDHLNGVLFVDLVKDTKSYMTPSEYRKRIVKNERKVKN